MYLYHASAHGLGGRFTRPITDEINPQAATALSSVGGGGSATQKNYEFPKMIWFESASVEIKGSRLDGEQDETHATSVTAIVEKLNILDVVKADKITLQLNSQHRRADGPEPTFTADKSSFENLKVKDHLIEIDEWNHPTLAKYDTYKKFQTACTNAGPPQEILDCVMGCGLQTNGADPPHLTEVVKGYNDVKDFKDPEKALPTPILCSIVKHIKPLTGAPDIKINGPIIIVPNFGTIYLGEVVVLNGMRRVNMLRLELGSPVAGSITASAGESNGTFFPP